MEVPEDWQKGLESRLKELQKQLDQLRALYSDKGPGALHADVAVFTKAVALALEHGEFYSPKDLLKADAALKMAGQRLKQLQAGEPTWNRV